MRRMTDIDTLKALGTGKPAPASVAALYREAFERYGARFLWSRKPSAEPTIRQALVIADALRREGNRETMELVMRIEEACRAAV
jgi:hypothetical protein